MARAYQVEALSNRNALALLNTLYALPQVVERAERPGTFAMWSRLACRDTPSPKVWMDAYLAAFAITAGLQLVSLDADFKGFEAQGLNLLVVQSSG